MRPLILSVVLIATAAASPALAQPLVVAGSPANARAPATAPHCAVRPAGPAATEVRCRTAGGEPSEVRLLVSAEAGPAPDRCSSAVVVAVPGAPERPRPSRPLIVHAPTGEPCGA